MTKSTAKKTKVKTAKPAQDIFPKIQKIIAGQLKKQPNQIPLAANLQTDLDADSLDALEIIFQLEETFNIKIAEEEATQMVTVQNIVSAVTKKVSA